MEQQKEIEKLSDRNSLKFPKANCAKTLHNLFFFFKNLHYFLMQIVRYFDIMLFATAPR